MLLPDILEDIRYKLYVLLLHISYEDNEVLKDALKEIENIIEDVNES
jgi:CRISPR/Cas system-associated exonuclease Cas4 (RecB family)